MQKLGRRPAAKVEPEYEPGIVPAREEQIKPVVGNHMVYGNAQNMTSAARSAAAARAINEGILRNAYDENKKAIRVAVIDEDF